MILLLGGTSDSLQIAEALEQKQMAYYLSVTTAYGKQLASAYTSRILEGKLDGEAMEKVVEDRDILCIIDATHPYAVDVSKNAMEVAKKKRISYIRYERASLLKQVQGEKIHIVSQTEEACELASQIGHRIFLGTGSKTLPTFTKALNKQSLVVRVLPTSTVIAECEQLGLNPENIIAMKGPFDQAMNEALFKHYGIDCMITKESGSEGGFLEKIAAAKTLGIETIIIKRNPPAYPVVTESIEELLKLTSLRIKGDLE